MEVSSSDGYPPPGACMLTSGHNSSSGSVGTAGVSLDSIDGAFGGSVLDEGAGSGAAVAFVKGAGEGNRDEIGGVGWSAS